ncbi:MAG TPA: amino acid adenylation domain-containing protein, partial [Roseiflexaceae bacterium]|nr:amino acid adenylation domain-containing protein [Roseiflexaceae bacterium]
MSKQRNTLTKGGTPDLAQITDLVSLLQARAADQPDQIAYTFLRDGIIVDRTMTYAELDRRARAIAARLQQIGTARARVLLLYPSGLDFLIGFFACLYADRIAIPVNLPRPNRPMPRLQAIVADAQATVGLTTADLQADLLSRCEQIPALGELEWLTTDELDDPAGWQPPELSPDTVAYLQYTSGSTATPKGVMVSHYNLLLNLAMLNTGWDHTAESVIVSWLPLFHDMGLIYGALFSTFLGIHTVLMTPVNFLQQPLRWLQAISAFRGTHSAAPNFAYDMCVQKVTAEQRAELDLSSWKLGLNGAEPVRRSTLEGFAEYFAPCGFRAEVLSPGYGLAEATLKVSTMNSGEGPVFCTVRADAFDRNRVVPAEPGDPQARVLIGVGRPALDMQVAIVDPERGERCPPDGVGEIWVSSASVAQGYWRRPEETEQTFRARLRGEDQPFLRTGDLGFVHDGIVYITGRLKDLIIVRGRNLYPQDIELSVERSNTSVRQNCTAAFSIEAGGEEQLVVVSEVERQHRHGSLEAVVEAIRQTVTEQHEVQVYAVVLIRPGSIPKTSSGKLQRRACRAEFSAGTLPVIHEWRDELPPTPAAPEAAPKAPGRSAAEIRDWLVQRMAEHTRVAAGAIDVRAPFQRFRLDSINAVRMIGDLGDWLGRTLNPTLAYDYPSIAALAGHLAPEDGSSVANGPAAAADDRLADEPIAIVGMGCRFPGAADLDAFWRVLRDGQDAVGTVPSERWDAERFYDPTPATPGKSNTRWGGFLEQVDLFDAPFFSVTPREASRMDPQQRLLLEVAWEALEHAGIAPERLAGTPAGVFVGISTNEYQRLMFAGAEQLDGYAGSGTALSIAANRLSYLLNLRGPSLAVDTACSSSLVAVHLACRSLRSGESSVALAGGVHLMLTPELSVALAQARMLSGSGRCRTFDAAADGYVRGEGCGVVVLKRLSDALRDGDTVYALVAGSAVNQDGRSNGLNAPSGPAQQEVIQAALRDAGAVPQAVGYVEAHGTGTSLGDPIEVGALTAALGAGRSPQQRCLLGSVKTNIGHLEAAAGIAGLIKTALALWHDEIPAHLHLTQLNPYIALDGTPFQIPTASQPWPAAERRLAGVSSFGFGGTNAHVVLAEAPAPAPAAPLAERPWHLLALSGRSETALRTLAERYVAHLDAHPDTALADLCATANAGRNHAAHRLAAVADSVPALRAQLQALAGGQTAPRLLSGPPSQLAGAGVVWLFSGQGAQSPQMGRQLYETQPVFRAALDRCAEILLPHLGQDIRSIIFEEPEQESTKDTKDTNGSRQENAEPRTENQGLAIAAQHAEVQAASRKPQASSLNQTGYAQPALFAFEYALAELWRSWGVTPAAVMGHSVGEYVAACVAGVFSLEDGLRLIAERARLMQTLPPGGRMAVVLADEARVAAALVPFRATVALAAVNGPANCTIAGPEADVDAVLAELHAAGVTTRPVRVSHAFHSPLMDPITASFERVAAGVAYAPPQIPLVSNLTGAFWADGTAPDAAYWRRHLREPVRFADGLRALAEQGFALFLEIGPATTLVSLGRSALPEDTRVWIGSLKRGQDDWATLLQAAGRLYLHGAALDWAGIERGFPQRQRLALPTSPFERRRHWLPDTPHPTARAASEIGAAMKQSNVVQADARPHGREAAIRERVRGILVRFLEMDAADLSDQQPFLEIGADSIVLIQAIQTIQSTFGIEISIRQLFEQLNTLAALAKHIDAQLPPEAAAPAALPAAPAALPAAPVAPPVAPVAHLAPPAALVPPPAPVVASAEGSSLIERVMAQQLGALSNIVAQQLSSLQPGANGHAGPAAPANGLNGYVPYTNGHSNGSANGHSNGHSNGSANGHSNGHSNGSVNGQANGHSNGHSNGHANGHSNGSVNGQAAKGEKEPEPFVPYKAIEPGSSEALTPEQQAYLDGFVARYTARTARSKQEAARFQRPHADLRTSMHFHLATKELRYPIVAGRSEGSRIWDLDGNEYVDLTTGFGVNLFGHQEPFIIEAIEQQTRQGIHVGPQSDLAGEMAELMCELTGMERVTFCNSGSEAVMTALRIARAATGRSKIAIFAGSYHGTFDGILATSKLVNGAPQTIPMAPGVPASMVADTLVLPYGTDRALEQLRAHAHELAAVLVEPVQSRRPDFQPREFLHELRRITAASGAALIFDEVITGFRLHPGGAQAHFGIQADLATYGKVIGGGLPIGAIAGRSAFMDAVDGGAWSFGDRSYPTARTTFYSGTFCKHPLAMAAGRAVLRRLKQAGPQLQAELNARVTRLAETLNAFLTGEGLPIQVVWCGSLFRFNFPFQLTLSNVVDLWFYHLVEQGVYVWEGRNCIISTAHSDADLDRIVAAVQHTVAALRSGGFLPERPGGGTPDGGPGGRRQTAPLTDAQQQQWMLAQLGQAGSEVIALDLRGPLETGHLGRALQQVVDRHEALRTTIANNGDVQHIAPALPIALPLVDLSQPDGGEGDARAAQWLEQESRRGLDLVRGPLVRAHLLRLGAEHHLLVLNMHHAVVDGWSIGVILRELGALYTAAAGGAPARLPEPVQFQTYARWLAAQLQSGRTAGLERYWLQKLAGPLPVLHLPTDRPRPAIKTYTGARQSLLLPADLTASVRRVGRQQGTTLFMTLLAGYLVLLHQASDQDDILIGFPVSGRALPGSEQMVGYCSHQVVLRSVLDGAPDFAAFLASVKRELLDVYEHQDLPFATLLNRLKLERDPSRSPLIAVSFNLERTTPMPQMAGLAVTYVSSPLGFAEYDAHLNVTELDDRLLVEIDYNTDLFDAATARALLDRFGTLLGQAAADTHTPVRAATPQPAAALPDGCPPAAWNATFRDYPQDVCLHDLFAAQVARTPDATAVVYAGQRLTYTELDARANQLARHLRGLGVGPDSLVGICAERSIELVVGLYGILKAGGAYLPLDPSYPPDRLAFMLADAQAPVLLTAATSPALAATLAGPWSVVDLVADWATVAQQPTSPLDSGCTPVNLAYVIYTSGSTGRPKGVQVPHSGIVNRLLWMQEEYGLAAGDRVLQKTPFSFDVSVWEFFWPLLVGAQLVLARPEGHKDSAYLVELIQAEQITTLHFVPPMLRAFLEQPGVQGCRSLRRVICSGEALPYDLQERFFARLGAAELHNLYGPTEASVDVTYWACRRDDPRAVVPIGLPVANTQMYVLDGALRPVPVGSEGELYIGGVQLARGYLNRPDLTAERFVPNPFGAGGWGRGAGEGSGTSNPRLYRTGDLARYLPDGAIEYLGRIDQQVKIRGFRIELGEIEAVLAQHPAVGAAAVLARASETGNARLVAYVVPAKNGESGVGVAELKAFLSQRLPEHMVPAAYVLLERLPLSPNGKLDRKALPEPASEPAERAGYVAPRKPLERTLADIWGAVLKVERVGIYDDFIALGGDSILSIQVVVRAGEAGIQLASKDLFEYPTVAELAALAGRTAATRGGEEPQGGSDQSGGDTYPLSPMQQGMLFHSLYAETAGAYLEQIVLALPGQLDPAAFARAWEQAIERHAVLRTAFVWDEGAQPRQVVQPAATLPLQQFDWRGLAASEQEQRLDAYIEQVRSGPAFDLNRPPLMRLALFRVSDAATLCVWSYHQLLMDGWSHTLLLDEVRARYAALAEGRAPAEPTRRPYRDHIAWVQRQDLDRAASFWRAQLQGFAAPTPLGIDRPHAGSRLQPTEHYGQQSARLSAPALARLHALARQHRLTLNTLIQGAWALLLHRYSGADDVLFGAVVSGRSSGLAGVETMLGLLINTLPVRVRVSPSAALLPWLANIQAGLVQARDYEYAPLVAQQGWSEVPSDMRLFESVLVFENFPGGEADAWPALNRSPLRTGYPLHISVRPGTELHTTVTYDAQRFDDASIGRLLGHFHTLLAGMADGAERPLAALPLLTAHERRLLLEDWTATAAPIPFDTSFLDLFEAQVARTPDAVAVRAPDQTLTYRALSDQARLLAAHLLADGVGPEALVAVLADRGAGFLTAVLASFMAGAAYLPLDPRHPPARLRQVLAQGQPALVLVTPEHQGSIDSAVDGLQAGQRPPVRRLDTLMAAPAPGVRLPSLRPESLAYIIYTSGST